MHLKGKLSCVGVSDAGRVREHNEDTIGTDADIGLVVLADGMGGYKAGEVASGIAVRTVMSLLKDAVEREDLTLRDPSSGLSRPGILLRDAIQRANKIIYQTARTQAHCEGMGTTVVAGLFFDDKLTIAHVGDSRLYRLRGQEFAQVTRDHSLLQELVLRCLYTPQEAQRATAKNYVTRALDLGSFPISVTGTDTNGCPGSRDYTLVINAAGPFVPTALSVDAAGNTVFEAGKSVAVAPSWRNDTGVAQATTGAFSNFTGPAGPSYTISDAAADYGTQGIRVNCVCPGYIETPMTTQTVVERGDALMAKVPQKRLGQPQDIAEAVVWLCSDRAGFVTGHAQIVDGGYTAI